MIDSARFLPPAERRDTSAAHLTAAGHRRRTLLLASAGAGLWPGLGAAQSAAPAPTPASPAAPEAEWRAGVVELLRNMVSDSERPLTGISVAWLRGEEGVSRAWAGWRQVGVDHPTGSVPLDANTLYRVASLSKLALAVVALRLHDARLLDLDEDLSAPLKVSLRHPQHREVAITPRLLLSHRSGLLDRESTAFADGDALRRALASPSQWGSEAPGRVFRYSNLGPVVLATAMEAVTRMPFEALMQRWLFDPIGMTARYLPSSLRPEQREQLSTLYRRPTGSRVWVAQADAPGSIAAPASLPAPGENASVYSPHGGMRCHVSDLARLAKLLMQEGSWEGRKLLSADAYANLIKPHWTFGPNAPGDTANGLFRSWGAGAQIFTDRSDNRGGDRLHPAGGVTAYGHLGLAYGLHAGLLFHPATGSRPPWGLAYVINGTSQSAEDTLGQHSSLARVEERVVERLLEALQLARPR